MGPTVAVAMPVHNAAALVDEALGSVAAQTRRPDEVIVVDDASSDSTADIVAGWADRLPIQLIRLEQNVGCGAARSVAVDRATADVIAPLDADDVWLPHHLETNLTLVSQSTVAATRHLLWAEGAPADAPSAGHDVPPPTEQATTILRKNFLFSGSLYWRETLLGAGGHSVRRTAEDRENWIRLLCRAGCTAIAPETATVAYRVHPASLSYREGSLHGVIDTLEAALVDAESGVDRRSASRALRRYRARALFLDGLTCAAQGEMWSARRLSVAAALQDRSLRGWLDPGDQGSVTLRAIGSLVAPGRAAEVSAARRLGQPLPTPAER